MQKWDEEGREAEGRGKKRRARQRGRRGERFTDRNEIIEEARGWLATKPRERKTKMEAEDYYFPERVSKLVCGCSRARRDHTHASFSGERTSTVIPLSSTLLVLEMQTCPEQLPPSRSPPASASLQSAGIRH